jgi:dipeptidyl aminopeptidase/acylaminoacyl peptidase
MKARAARPYGSWPSAIRSGAVAEASLRLSQPRFDSDVGGEWLYWLEGRPAQAGRQVVMRRRVGPGGLTAAAEEVTHAGVNVRTRVHEYGGGDYCVSRGRVFYSDFADQRVYAGRAGEPGGFVALSPGGAAWADFVVSPDARWLVAVEERARPGGEPLNRLVAFELAAAGERMRVAEPRAVAEGHDFVSSARFSPDGLWLAFIAWQHPDMPWDATRLFRMPWGAQGPAGSAQCVAGGPSESIVEPSFSPSGRLHFVSDRSGWWNLWALCEPEPVALCPRAAEFAQPPWVFGLSSHAFLGEREILCSYGRGGSGKLARLDLASHSLRDLALPFSRFSGVAVAGRQAAFLASGADRVEALQLLDLDTGALHEVVASTSIAFEPELFSRPEPFEFRGAGGCTGHAWYYAPANPAVCGSSGERPPLLVKCHGGPTSAANPGLDLRVQFWTSRGIAVLDVDYGGSSGHGRAYRERLRGQWGVVDVQDCVAAAQAIAEQGRVDAIRLAISGASAGGYTALCALTFQDVFAAGASYYGIGDLEALLRDTHKFESRYLDGLIGPYPERRDLYVARSPLHACDRLQRPVIFFQGLEDRVVPPNQAEEMVAALAQRGIAHAYVPFEGEQHGFRRAENIRTALACELFFYSQIFGFEVDEHPSAVRIHGRARS